MNHSLSFALFVLLVIGHAVPVRSAEVGIEIYSKSSGKEYFQIIPEPPGVRRRDNVSDIDVVRNGQLPRVTSRTDAKVLHDIVERYYYDCGVPLADATGGATAMIGAMEWADAIATSPSSENEIVYIIYPEFTSNQGWAAIVDLHSHSLITPPCPANVVQYAVAPGDASIALATRELERLDFKTGNRSARYTGDFLVYWLHGRSPAGKRPFARFTAPVVGLHIDNSGEQLFVLVEERRLLWANPLNWFLLIAGHPPYESKITLYTLSSDMAVLDEHVLERRAKNGWARFIGFIQSENNSEIHSADE